MADTCRICLSGGPCWSICDTFEQCWGVFISDMLEICCGLRILPDEGLPVGICEECLVNLNTAYKLRKTCEESESILRQVKPEDILEEPPQEDHVLTEEIEEPLEEYEPSDVFEHEDHHRDTVVEETNAEDQNLVEITESLDHVDSTNEDTNIPTGSSRRKTCPSMPATRRVTAGEFFCKLCRRNFARQDIFLTHVKRHNDEKNFQCNYCGKDFVNKFELQRHERVHTREKPFKCKYCDKAFSDYNSRSKHYNVHLESRPYVCNVCNRGFNYPHVLQAHMVVHTGEKKHQCSICEKRFGLRHHLKKHMETHQIEEIVK